MAIHIHLSAPPYLSLLLFDTRCHSLSPAAVVTHYRTKCQFDTRCHSLSPAVVATHYRRKCLFVNRCQSLLFVVSHCNPSLLAATLCYFLTLTSTQQLIPRYLSPLTASQCCFLPLTTTHCHSFLVTTTNCHSLPLIVIYCH